MKKLFLASDSKDQFFVALEADTEKLTPELAHKINDYWGGGTNRLDSEDGDVVRAVLRLLGFKLITFMLTHEGATFDERNGDNCHGANWLRSLLESEGLLRARGLQPEMLGIRVVKADVQPPGFEEIDLESVKPEP